MLRQCALVHLLRISCGGVYLFSGIVSALYGREKSQRGAHVDIAMFDATLSFLEHGLMAYIATWGKSPQRLGNRHPYMAPFDVFNTQDKPITICCGNDKLFFCVMPGTGAYGTG